MNITEAIRNKMRDFLKITENTTTSLIINTTMNHDTEANFNKVLYRSDPTELQQAFKQLDTGTGTFWAAVPSHNRQIRKISTRMYPGIIDRHSDILITGMNPPKIENHEDQEIFNNIFSDVNEQSFNDIIKKLDTDVMVTGDACVKVTIDTELSEYPILEVVDGSQFEPIYKRNKLHEIVFYTEYHEKKKRYTLQEKYGKGYIKYRLFNEDGKEVPMGTVEELENLQDVEFAGDYIMAVFVKYWDSPKYKNRGRNLINNYDAIDALDEIVSQWQDAVRRGRVNKYIPSNMIPRDQNGRLMASNPFDNDFIATASSGQEGSDKIESIQPDIQYEAYETTYVSRLQDLLMSSGMSPSSMGIDAKKYDDNATAQREREKLTGWTRAQRIEKLNIVIPKIINIVLMTYENMIGATVKEHTSTASFDEFASPTLEEIIEVLNKACPGQKLMSNKTVVEMMANALNRDKKWEQEELSLIESESDTSYQDEDYFPNIPDNDNPIK